MKMHITIEGDNDATFRVYHPYKKDITINIVSLYIILRLIAHTNNVKWPIYRLFPKVVDKKSNTIKHMLRMAMKFTLGQKSEMNISIEQSKEISKLLDETNFNSKITNKICQELAEAYDAGTYDEVNMYSPYFKFTKNTPDFIK